MVGGNLSRNVTLSFTCALLNNLAYARAVTSNPVVSDRYYDILEQALTDNDLLDSPVRYLIAMRRECLYPPIVKRLW